MKNRKKLTGARAVGLLRYLPLILWVAFFVFAFGWIVLASFSTTKEIFSNGLLQSGVHVENYTGVWERNHVAHYFVNSLITTGIPCVLIILIAAPSGLQRLERDVLAYHPDLTVVCFGLNDACRGDETQEEYASALDGIFTKLKEAGSEIIFMTPNMMNTRLSEKLTVPEIRAVAEDTLKIQLDGRLERYLDAAREVCTRQGAAVCDCYAKWKLLSQNGVDTTALLANGINHPSREMAWMFAYSLLETMMR